VLGAIRALPSAWSRAAVTSSTSSTEPDGWRLPFGSVHSRDNMTLGISVLLDGIAGHPAAGYNHRDDAGWPDCPHRDIVRLYVACSS
jgi:hypothetical protein